MKHYLLLFAKALLLALLAVLIFSTTKTREVYACAANCATGGLCSDAACADCSFCQGGTNQIFGQVNPPPGVDRFGSLTAGGPTTLLNNIIKTLIVIAGVYSLFNFVLAGYGFLSASGDPKKIEQAWAKISQTIIGLAFTAGAFVIAALVGQIIFGDPTALLRIRLFGPGN